MAADGFCRLKIIFFTIKKTSFYYRNVTKTSKNSLLANTLHFYDSFVDFKYITGGFNGEITAPSELTLS